MEQINQNQPGPNNNLVWAILTTVFCCVPLGIVAIVKAASVDGLWNSGRYEEAVKASEDAKKFSMYGAGCGLVLCLLYIAYMVFCFGLGILGGMSGW